MAEFARPGDRHPSCVCATSFLCYKIVLYQFFDSASLDGDPCRGKRNVCHSHLLSTPLETSAWSRSDPSGSRTRVLLRTFTPKHRSSMDFRDLAPVCSTSRPLSPFPLLCSLWLTTLRLLPHDVHGRAN